MTHSGAATRFAGIAAVLLIGLAGCATYRSNYFTLVDDKPASIDRFRLTPRIFAFKESRVSAENARTALHYVTLRVEDPTIKGDDESWQQSRSQIDSLADRFLRKVTDVFVIDSLVLHETPPSREHLTLIPDHSNYSPRRDNYLTFKFGRVDFPRETVRLRAVLHFTRAGQSPSADSLLFQMWRVTLEERGLMMFKSNTQGY